MHGSKYVTNHRLEKDVGCKVLQFINTIRLRSSLITKPYGIQMQQFLQEKDELRQNSVSGHNLLEQNLCIKFHSLASTEMALKINLIYV